MPRPRLLPVSLSLALVAALSGCSKPASGDAPATAPAATSSAAATGDAPAPASAARPHATETAASGFVLDMDKVDAYYATIGKLAEMAKSDPSPAGNDDEGDDDDPIAMDASESIDAYIARIEADPKAKRMVTSAGMSVPDYAHTNAALLEGMMAAGMMEATGKTAVPAGINPQYVEFAQQHKAELDAKMKALQAQYGGE